MEVRLDERLVIPGRVLDFFDVGQFFGDSPLLALEEIEGDRAGVVSFEQLAAFLEKPLLALPEALLFGSSFGVVGGEILPQPLLDDVHELSRERDGSIVLLDKLLDPLDQDGAHGAIGALLMAPDADEVGIDPAGVALGVSDDHAAAAVAAVDALEVVRVLADFVLGGKDFLNLLPQLRRD
jgi:hypothetical protein